MIFLSRRRVASLSGRYFSANWCGPCRAGPPKTACFGNTESALERRFRLGSVSSTVPEWPLSGGRCHPYSHRLSRVDRSRKSVCLHVFRAMGCAPLIAGCRFLLYFYLHGRRRRATHSAPNWAGLVASETFYDQIEPQCVWVTSCDRCLMYGSQVPPLHAAAGRMVRQSA